MQSDILFLSVYEFNRLHPETEICQIDPKPTCPDLASPF
jgi:hypothetical protein